MTSDPSVPSAPQSPVHRPVYLDNHATTRVDPRVVEAMLPWFDVWYGNAASINHAYGTEAAAGVEEARTQIGLALNCSPTGITFTSGGTESNNLALKGILGAAPQGRHLIISAVEHRSVLDTAKRLQRRGARLTVLGVDQHGQVDPQAVAQAIAPDTVLVSVILANNEVGTINPVAEIAAICRERGVLCHTDAVQAVGKIPVDLDQLGVDLASFTAHKIYGPKGTGALFVRPRESAIRLEPQLDGGGHERRLRSGTLAVPLIVGFAEACRLAAAELPKEVPRLQDLRDRLWHGLETRISQVHLNGHPSQRLPGNLNVSFADVDGEQLMHRLTRIAVSSGSACTSAEPEPSHVLKAMGLSESQSKASLRMGLGRFNTAADVDLAIEHLAQVIEKLRAR
ncbi:MAG: cysteine desulfurase [Planctomycetes bacterium]|nr:cysteine desulfurase [Planctomycetota bacterium]